MSLSSRLVCGNDGQPYVRHASRDNYRRGNGVSGNEDFPPSTLVLERLLIACRSSTAGPKDSGGLLWDNSGFCVRLSSRPDQGYPRHSVSVVSESVQASP
ncbi:hypothetical protein HRR83_002956 [Exophiala dermatitidis]|nr:hypothetical protein HRR73_008038 [Exophiala dermatitidis]KAJ4520616.1 hypothetical protein HRR74_003614 [Exophiala dermatitidis]KAJ4537744.1 hypothetical protein HRR76_005733 [Exophiala dermatitidis]KAJ4551593.1 hypothetical protein HRR77_002826 [Exophiala dermatitidis]KAJ4569327.1 hypothetical protein HRR79_004180 [Exophiala dermatitidis]